MNLFQTNNNHRHTTNPSDLHDRASMLSAVGLAIAVGVAAFVGGACGSQEEAGTPVGGPWQTIEANVDPDIVDSLLAATDLSDAREVADFHIYRPEPEGLDLEAPNCGLIEATPIDTTCGGCFCMPEMGIVCVDYTCDPAALRFEAPTAQASVEHQTDLRPAPRACDNGTWPGDSWMDECNMCTCLGDGTIACTMMKCADAPM